jgi:para-nitrobenzyl esterase
VFRGIRYAAPPVGELRFAPPAPFSTATGVPLQFEGALAAPPRAAPAPLQNTGMMLGSRPVGATAEDCLFLDVFTPALDGRRPVMVWIYGGGFVGGSGVDVLTHGSRLAALGDVVVVTFNYRLGALGFLHWDEAGDGPTAPRCATSWRCCAGCRPRSPRSAATRIA